jgi:hypothetical protein
MNLKYKVITNGYTLCSVPSLKYARKIAKNCLFLGQSNIKIVSYLTGKEVRP